MLELELCVLFVPPGRALLGGGVGLACKGARTFLNKAERDASSSQREQQRHENMYRNWERQAEFGRYEEVRHLSPILEVSRALL